MRFIILFTVVKTYSAILYIVGYVKWEVLQVGSSSSSFGRLNYGNDQKVKCKHQFLAILRHRGQITTQAEKKIEREE